MKKRRELNALIKNNCKYKGVPLKSQTSMPNSSSIDMYHIGNGSGTSRLLKNDNDSSSENEEFYFSANKSMLKHKQKSYYCKIFQMLVVGLLITFGFLIGIILLFSYSKFHEILNDLKKEVDNKNKQNQNDLNDLKRQIVEYDQLFKQVNSHSNKF